MKLYHYVNISQPEQRGWYATPAKFREALKPGRFDTILRTAHVGVKPPPHYHKPNGELACDAIEKIPTMQDLINKL